MRPNDVGAGGSDPAAADPLRGATERVVRRSPRGRRPGRPDTRGAILDAAKEAFLRFGYTHTSLRGVARAAGVDPALVHHYFGTKHDLFLAMAHVAVDPSTMATSIAAGGRENLGPRLVGAALTVWESPLGANLVAAVRSVPALMPAIAEYVSGTIVRAGRPILDVPDAEFNVRAGLTEAVMVGLFLGRYVTRIEPLASLPREVVTAAMGPQVQQLLTGDLPTASGCPAQTATTTHTP